MVTHKQGREAVIARQVELDVLKDLLRKQERTLSQVRAVLTVATAG